MKELYYTKHGRREFLRAAGYGIALSALPRISFASNSNPDVVVIGAGAAGLSAMAELMSKGKSVVCIEAMNRIGGRCYTDNSIFGVPYDMGAHWLHGYSSNQLAEYGKKQKGIFNIYKDHDESYRVYDGKKKLIWPEDKPLWDLYDEIKNIASNATKDVPLIDLIPENLKKNEWFGSVQKIFKSRDYENQTVYDGRLNWQDPGEGDGFCRQGYGTLLAHYRKDVPVKLNTLVNEIKWNGKDVKVETNNGTITAKACIVTVSTGVLNAGKIKFTPDLPKKKYEAFDGISMTPYHRVTLQLKESFYEDYNISNDTYWYRKVKNNYINKQPYPKSSNGTLKVCYSNISFFSFKGQFATDMAKEGDQASVDFILNYLRSAYGSNFDKYFIKAHVTDWIDNPYTIGAWSSALPGKAKLRKVLKKSVKNKIFFAGEATAGAYGTVHGADRSGKRAVKELLKKVKI